MKELFKNRSFKLLFAGNMVSEIGNVLFGFVSGLYVQDITGGSPILFALFIALGSFVRILFSPIAGALVDRWDKVKIIYITDYIRGVMFIGLAYIFYIGIDVNTQIIILLVGAVVSGIISAFFGPAVTSATPEIVGLDKVQAANGANSIIQSSTMILGVVLGAAAFGLFDFTTAVLINGISFMLSGFSEMFIKAEHKEEIPPHEEPHMLRDIAVGFKYIKKKEGLLRMMTYSLFLNFAFSPLFAVGIPFLFRSELERGEWEIAWQNIAFGIAMMIAGVVVGSITFKRMTIIIRRSLVMLSGSFIMITIVIYLLSEGVITYWTFYTLIIILNISLAVFMMATNVPLNTSLVKIIDPEVRGRVFATIGAISGGAVPIAMFLAGPVIQLTSVAFLGITCSALLLVPTLGFLTDRKVTRLLQGIEGETNGQLQETI